MAGGKMSSPGIDKWVEKAPESWAKLAKTKRGLTFEEFKKKFFEGAEKENKAYLKTYLRDYQLKKIYESTGRTITKDKRSAPKKEVRKTLIVTRNGKTYTRTNTPRWNTQTSFVLKLAAREKPRSEKYDEYANILINQGRTRQAVTKKIQRVRKKGA